MLRYQIDLTPTRFTIERRRYGLFFEKKVGKKMVRSRFLMFFEGLHLENVPIFWVVFRDFSSRNACYNPDFMMSVKSEFFATKNIFMMSRENTYLALKTQKKT